MTTKWRKSFAGTILCICLGGCGTISIFDPAPYNPTFDSQVRYSLDFDNLSDAAKNLNGLAVAYAQNGDSLTRQQLAFDVPILGLAAATVAAGVYGGSKNLVLGLGLGTAGATGAKLYFNPQARAAAYNGAALGLACGASVATQLNTILTTEKPWDVATDLLTAINAASRSSDKSTATAVTAGQKALSDLMTANGVIFSAPARLQGFAASIIRGTTTKAATGVQNIDAALAAIRAASPSATGSGTTTKPVTPQTAVKYLGVPPTPQIPEQLLKNLQTATAVATNVTKDINDAWSNMTSCTLQTTAS
jgi:hypothetical protein